jgi:hypothetical protein
MATAAIAVRPVTAIIANNMVSASSLLSPSVWDADIPSEANYGVAVRSAHERRMEMV